MFEKFRIIFTIPELRQKIFLTLLFLAIYRVGWQIPLPVVNQQAMTAHFETGGLADLVAAVSVFSCQPIKSGHYFWPWDYALYLGFDYFPVARKCLETARRTQKRRRERAKENQ